MRTVVFTRPIEEVESVLAVWSELTPVQRRTMTIRLQGCSTRVAAAMQGKSNMAVVENERRALRKAGLPRLSRVSITSQYTYSQKHRLKKYGLTEEQLSAMRDAQGQKCACCGELSLLGIDHCHATGRVRGLLCHPCNMAVGVVLESAERARAVARYIEEQC